MKFRLYDSSTDLLILYGELFDTGSAVKELKTFIQRPQIVTPVLEVPELALQLEARHSGRGWQIAERLAGSTVGLNLFRVRNRRDRYAVTVWIESPAPVTIGSR